MKVIRLNELVEVLGVSKVTIWRWRKSDQGFPQPVLMGPKLIGWNEAEIQSWLNSSKGGV